MMFGIVIEQTDGGAWIAAGRGRTRRRWPGGRLFCPSLVLLEYL